jgi:outer membrane protein assembly factor BamB
MRHIIIFYLIIALASCTQGKKTQNEQPEDAVEIPAYRLELVWASDTLLKTPESVCFDKERKVLYISNVNLNPWEKDGNGFISKMDLSGNIIELEWVQNLHGPKGMGISNGSLFIADIDEIVKANIETGEITDRFSVEGNPDLNDITVGEDGTVYITGSGSNKIYALKNGEVTEFLAGSADERFNGLYWEKSRLLLITSGSSQFKAIDWDTKSVSIISESMGHGDGIVSVGEGAYLTSSWAGAIFHVASDGTTTRLLNTEADSLNTADFDYSAADNLLFVPTFFDNRVMAYKLVL